MAGGTVDGGPGFGDVVADYRRWMARRGLSPGTVEAYERTVIRLARWAHGRGLDVFELDADELDAWLDSRSLSPRTRRNVTSYLSTFYRWAQRTGRTSSNPAAIVERPRVAPDLPRPIHDADLGVALALADPCMRTVLALMAYGGLRCCEVAGLRWRDVQLDAVRVEHGKGGRARVVPCHPEVVAALDALDRDGVYVVPLGVVAGRVARAHALSRRTNVYLRSLGIDDTAHALRHWCGTAAYRATHDIRAVQQLLGHASPSTTAVYTAVSGDAVRGTVAALPVVRVAP